MRQAMDRWMDERGFNNFGFSSSNQNTGMSLAVDVHETETGYELNASMPGVKPEDVEISVDKDMVTIRGRTEQKEERQQGNYIYRERHGGSFQRTLRLPDQINAEQVEASLEHGVLKVTLPRLQQTTQRRIQVKSGANTGSQPIGTGSASTSPVTAPNADVANPTAYSDAATYAGTVSPTATAPGEGQTATTERPTILENLSSTQMDELERHASANDRQGFGDRTDGYGWDRQTTEQVWNYLTRRVSRDEVDRAFGNPG
jgi:HSP20 family protein